MTMCSTPSRDKDGVERRHEFVGHRAAQAAIGQFDDVLLRAGGVAAAFEDFAVDADVAELVDDDGEAAALRVAEHVADERRLAGAEKAGDDGAGNARERAVHIVHGRPLRKPMGGTRAISPRLRTSGRPRQGRMPSAAPRKQARAGDQRFGAGRRRVRRTRRSTSRCSAWRRSGRACNWRGSAAAAPRLRCRRRRCSVAAARIAPGRGSLSGFAGALAGDADVDDRRGGRGCAFVGDVSGEAVIALPSHPLGDRPVEALPAIDQIRDGPARQRKCRRPDSRNWRGRR